MSRPDSTHSVPVSPGVVKSRRRVKAGDDGVKDASMLLLSILHDPGLRASALGIAILASLLACGAAGETLVPANISQVACELGTTYDSVYKGLRGLVDLGYVQMSKVGRSLFLRAVWPQTKPASRRRKSNGPKGA